MEATPTGASSYKASSEFGRPTLESSPHRESDWPADCSSCIQLSSDIYFHQAHLVGEVRHYGALTPQSLAVHRLGVVRFFLFSNWFLLSVFGWLYVGPLCNSTDGWLVSFCFYVVRQGVVYCLPQ